jgi:HEPN domain-containing protein
MSHVEMAALFLRKARQDLVAAETLSVTPGVSDEIVGFHCQQAAEKLLKAWLTRRARPFPRTHNLLTLLELVETAGGTPPPDVQEIDTLTPYGVFLRYDELETGAVLERERALELVRGLEEWVVKSGG